MPDRSDNSADVVIAGAGIAGVATAYHLAVSHHVTGVVLVDPRPALTLTSNRTGSNYREWWPRREMVALARRSIDLMERLREAGASFAMNRRGYLYVTTDPALAAALPELVQRYRVAGITPIRVHGSSVRSSYQPPAGDGWSGPAGADLMLDPVPVRQAFPHLSPAVSGAIHARRAGSFDTIGLGRCLLEAACREGTTLVRGEVTGVGGGDRVRSVLIRTAEGEQALATSRFVNAAGPFAARVSALLGAALPLRCVRQLKLTLPDPLGVVPREVPFTISLDPQGDRPGGLHIKPDESQGQPVVKLGWAFNRAAEEPAWEPGATPEFADVVLSGAAKVVPGLERYVRSAPGPGAVEAGYYVETPDQLPLIGPDSVEGAYLVAGLAGYGGMVACAAGEIAAAWIAGAERPPLATAFTPERFSRPDQAAWQDDRPDTGAL